MPGRGRQALPHLPLDHHQHAVDGRHLVQQVEHDGVCRGCTAGWRRGPTVVGRPAASSQSTVRASASMTGRRAGHDLRAAPAEVLVDLDGRDLPRPSRPGPGSSDPRPAPTSTTWSPGPTPARRTMRRTVLGSTTKFWPRARLGCQTVAVEERHEPASGEQGRSASGVAGPRPRAATEPATRARPGRSGQVGGGGPVRLHAAQVGAAGCCGPRRRPSVPWQNW